MKNRTKKKDRKGTNLVYELKEEKKESINGKSRNWEKKKGKEGGKTERDYKARRRGVSFF